MIKELRQTFTAAAEVEHSGVVRQARVTDLSIRGCYLTMPDPFTKGSSVLVKIRTERKFFQCHATVAYSGCGLGMLLEFNSLSPPFRVVLQEWLVQVIC
jgi:hypothetical protein